MSCSPVPLPSNAFIVGEKPRRHEIPTVYVNGILGTRGSVEANAQAIRAARGLRGVIAFHYISRIVPTTLGAIFGLLTRGFRSAAQKVCDELKEAPLAGRDLAQLLEEYGHNPCFPAIRVVAHSKGSVVIKEALKHLCDTTKRKLIIDNLAPIAFVSAEGVQVENVIGVDDGIVGIYDGVCGGGYKKTVVDWIDWLAEASSAQINAHLLKTMSVEQIEQFVPKMVADMGSVRYMYIKGHKLSDFVTNRPTLPPEVPLAQRKLNQALQYVTAHLSWPRHNVWRFGHVLQPAG